MALNTSIIRQLQPNTFGSLIDYAIQAKERRKQDENDQKLMRLKDLQIEREQSINNEDRRKLKEENTIRGLSQTRNGLRAEEDRTGFLSDLDTLKMGHLVPEFQQKFNQQAQQEQSKKLEMEKALQDRGDANLRRLIPLIKHIPLENRSALLMEYYKNHPELKDYDHGISLHPDGLTDEVLNQVEDYFLKPEDKLARDKEKRLGKEFERTQAEVERNNREKNLIEKNKPIYKNPELGMPLDIKKQIEVLSSKSAGKTAIANQLESDLNQLNSAMGLDKNGKQIPGAKPNEDLAYSYAQNMLKTMNSKEGADAVGVDEAKRAAGLLEYNVADVRAGLGMKPGKFHGRDMLGFIKQVKSNIDGIKGSVNFNKSEVDKLYGREVKPPSDLKPKKMSDDDILNQVFGQ